MFLIKRWLYQIQMFVYYIYLRELFLWFTFLSLIKHEWIFFLINYIISFPVYILQAIHALFVIFFFSHFTYVCVWEGLFKGNKTPYRGEHKGGTNRLYYSTTSGEFNWAKKICFWLSIFFNFNDSFYKDKLKLEKNDISIFVIILNKTLYDKY